MHDQEFLAVHFDFGPGVFAIEDFVPGFHIHRDQFAVFVDFALTGRNNFAFLGLLFGGVRNDEARSDFVFLFDGAYDHAVAQRS